MKKAILLIATTAAAWISPIEYELSIKEKSEILSVRKYLLALPIKIDEDSYPALEITDGLLMSSKWKLLSPIHLFTLSKHVPYSTITITDPSGIEKQLSPGGYYFIPIHVGSIAYSSFKNEKERLDWIAKSLDKMIDIPQPTEKQKINLKFHIETINKLLMQSQGINYEFNNSINYKPLSLAIKDKTGDCKVKATYLKYLLEGFNIKAEYVLTKLNTTNSNNSTFENSQKYDHVIIYLPKYGVYLDPTNEDSKPDILPGVLQWRTGLNLSTRKSVEISNKKPDIMKNRIKIELSKEGEFIVHQEIQATGSYGLALWKNKDKINIYNNTVKDTISYADRTFKMNRVYNTIQPKGIFKKTISDLAMTKKSKGDICNYNQSIHQEIEITPAAEKILSNNDVHFQKKVETYRLILKHQECPIDTPPLNTIIKKEYY